MKNLLPKNGSLFYRPDLFKPDEARKLQETLTETIQWDRPSLKMYGKEFPIPRLAAWYGEMEYKYSGINNIPHPWTKELLSIKKRVEEASGAEFNSVLLNLYRNGEDHMSWHSDDEKSLGVNPVIASVSFGEVRRFSVRHRKDKELSPITLELASGSLVIMGGEMQEYWHHRISPSKKNLGPRINLTFRKVISKRPGKN
jgi:alkylated DNA repair dioxygenase AlkB